MKKPFRILFVCQGGLNRSVMAAALAPAVFREKGFPDIETAAAAAFTGTEGHALFESVRKLIAPLNTLDAEAYRARFLTDELAADFDYLCFLDREAGEYRLRTLQFPQDRVCLLHTADPMLTGDHESAFYDIRQKMGILCSLLKEDNLI